jgi:ComF family protein
MFSTIKSYLNDFSHLFFPHNCLGCGTDVLHNDELLCTKCSFDLPETNFTETPNNPIEKIFYGRTDINAATAAYYFTKDSVIQQLLIQLKYKSNKEAGIFLGKKLGEQLNVAERFKDVDILIPLPLNRKKENIRGYNQAAIICDGIAEVFNRPIIKNAVIRNQFTETQTHQDRVHRWQNMQEVFSVRHKKILENKHVLLVDDVITTGATLEACATAILKISGTKISIATVAYTI